LEKKENLKSKRINFSSIKSIVDYPDFMDIQIKSFKDFFQLETLSSKKNEEGLYKVFIENFPIIDGKENFILDFIDYSLDLPKYSPEECIERGVTYAVPLKAKLKLSSKNFEDNFKDIEQEVFLGNIPYMTLKGSFIINGAERAIVSQLHRSPGVFFGQSKHTNGAKLYSSRVIPFRGSWIEFATDINNIMYAYIDRKKKFPITTLLRAIGYGLDRDILNIFKISEDIKVTRKELNKRIGDEIAARVLKRWTEDFVDDDTGEVVTIDRNEVQFHRKEVISKELIDRLLEENVKLITVTKNSINKSDYAVIYNSLDQDNSNSEREAAEQIYRQLKNTEAPDEQTAKEIIQNLFFSNKRYDLGEVGRYRINKKLDNINTPNTVKILTKEDIIKIVKYLVGLINSKAVVDDIDHLSNRRVRTVGEQLYNQFGIGLSRISRTIKEKMSIVDNEEFKPSGLVNARILSSVINSFFGTSPLSQFMDQINPLSEVTHKRRISALGPGGLSRERAGFEVRDVHYTHYGRLCTIETPEGPNIGLISSLCIYAKINNMGFIQTPYKKVENGKIDTGNKIYYLTAEEEDKYNIAQANINLDDKNNIIENKIKVRCEGDFPIIDKNKVSYIDIAPNQIVSIAASLIPFLEHDDANRALMGSNMQRQAVPLISPESPIVGTGVEAKVATDFRGLIYAKKNGTIKYVDSKKIIIKYELSKEEKISSFNEEIETYNLSKFIGTNQETCINLKPIVFKDENVKINQLLCEGYATQDGELALGRNLKVAFMLWRGYNFEDAIVISEKIIRDDIFTSIHIEEFELEVRDTKKGEEELTNEIPNVNEEMIKNLDENGIIKIGSKVKEGDILIGKITPKGETDPTPEEKLLRAIFGDKAGNVKDASLRLPPSSEGTVIEVKIFSKFKKDKDLKFKIKNKINELKDKYSKKLISLKIIMINKLNNILENKKSNSIYNKHGDKVNSKNTKFTFDLIKEKLFPDKYIYKKKINFNILEENNFIEDIIIDNWTNIKEINQLINILVKNYHKTRSKILRNFKREKFKLEVGDDLPTGIVKIAKVYIAKKRKLKVGDKMSGRHGNKGVVAKIVKEEDLPFLCDGTSVDIVLNAIGVPARMNLGQIYETILGWAGLELNKKYSTPIFDSASIQEIDRELKHANIFNLGKVNLYDGLSGKKFDQKVTVGVIYMLKLNHLIDDKMHARSIGPYSLITQQPLGGKSQFGGQRFGEMEVWSLEAFGAAYLLREILTIKSDDINGRTKAYEAIVKGENIKTPNLPESFNVLVHELKGLCLEITLN